MQELIQSLQEKAGLTEEQANKSLLVFIEFVKSKIPPALHGNIEAILGKMSQDNASGFTDKMKDFLD